MVSNRDNLGDKGTEETGGSMTYLQANQNRGNHILSQALSSSQCLLLNSNYQDQYVAEVDCEGVGQKLEGPIRWEGIWTVNPTIAQSWKA